MASKHAAAFRSVLLFLVLGYVTPPLWAAGPYSQGNQPPLPGANSVSGLEVRQDAKGRWMAHFDYFYTGAPFPAYFQIGLTGGSAVPEDLRPHIDGGLGSLNPDRGSHHVSFELRRPLIARSFATTEVWVHLRGVVETGQTKTIASQQVKQAIDWPDMDTWLFNRQFAEKTTEEILDAAVAQIDAGGEDALTQAKRTLERLISADPKFDAGYVELARIAMKSNWGPEGLHQAETLLQSALQVRPDSVNAKILLGYVYTHQSQYKLAEKLFKEAAASNTKNLWLWANWGELLVMQEKVDQGIEKYREAISRPRSKETYDRARLAAYQQLIALFDKRNELDKEEALYKQRADEFEASSCYFSDYARFVLLRRGDPAQAILLARKAVDRHCPEGREVLGLAYYAAWAAAPAERRAELLNQARVFLPVGPRPLYLLASSEHTIVAVRKLVDAGEAIDQYDNNKFNALAHAVRWRNYSIAARLIRLGARPEAPIGPAQMPVALLPVIEGDLDGISLMKKSGVDYSKLQYQGKSVLDHVKQSGDRKLIDALDSKKKVI